MFCGTQVMDRASQHIIVDRETGFQEVEIPVPSFNTSDWPPDGFKAIMNKYEPFNITGRIIQNGFRVVNRVFLQKFLVISDMTRNIPPTENKLNPIGTAEFFQKDDKYLWPVFVGELEHPKVKVSQKLAEEEASERAKSKHQYVQEISAPSCFRKVMVAREVRFIKIENNNQLFSEKQKVKSVTERIVDDPTSEETICIFENETLVIRLTNQIVRWTVTTWPSYLYSAGGKLTKNVDEFRFNVSKCYAESNKNKKCQMTFESGRMKRKIFIKIID